MEKDELENRISELELELSNLKRLKDKVDIQHTGKGKESNENNTARMQSESSKLLTQNFLDIIVEHSPNALWISDRFGTMIRMNQACRDVLQLSDEEVVGKYNIFHDNVVEAQGMMPLVRAVFEKGETVHFTVSYETSKVQGLKLKNSVTRFLHVNISPLFDSRGTVTNAIIQHVDITQRKIAEDALAQSEERYRNALLKAQDSERKLKKLNTDKDRFISILAHDLIGPFSPILGLLDLLSNHIHEYETDKIEELVNNINDSANRVFHLLKETLEWASAQSGKIPYNPQLLSFAEICADVTETLKPIFTRKNISVKYFSDGDDMVFADRNMFKAILRNLVSNAIKFTHEGGKISIYSEQNHKEVIITVSDNGMGIHPENLIKLLDSSQLYSTTGTDLEKGSGLGLIICKEFVEKHGGRIWIESEYEKGSNFKFTIPNPN